MRYWLLGLAVLMFVATAGTGQDTKKKKEDEQKEITEIAGKSFEQWVKEIHAKDPSDREIAIKTVLNFGPKRAYEAVPAILAELKKHKLGDPIDLSVRVNGTIALGTIFFATKEPDEKELKDAAKIFKANLEDKQAFLKIRTLQALPSLRKVGRDLLPEVVKATKDPTTWETRKEAIQALNILVQFDPKAGPPTGALQSLYFDLDDSSAIVKRASLQTLTTMGFINIAEQDKRTIIFKIDSLLKREKKATVIIEAHKAIIFLKRKKFDDPIDLVTKRDHLALIENMVQSKDPMTRLSALQALGSIGPAAASAAPAVISAIADPDGNLGGVAVEALMHMKLLSPIRKDYLKKIEYMVQAKASTTKLNALKALSATGPDAPDSAIKTVEDAIHDKDVNVGVAAITSLLHMEAYSSIPMLTTMKDDPKANEVLKAAAETAIDQFKYVKDMRKKISEKKKTDKK